MMSIKQLDMLNAAEDQQKRMGPDEPLPKHTDGYWDYENDERDYVLEPDNYCMDVEAYQKVGLFDDYVSRGFAEQWLKDMQAERTVTGSYKVFFESTETEFDKPIGDFDSQQWLDMVEAFGKACLWDELVSRIHGGTEEMMKRLGYHWVSEE